MQVSSLELLHALPFFFDDIEPFLTVFHPCASIATAQSLVLLCELGPRYASPAPAPQIANWLAERAPRALEEAVAAFPEALE